MSSASSSLSNVTVAPALLPALVLVLFGALWLCWLVRLHPLSVPPNAPPIKCHQVAPVLRAILLVFSVLFACSALFYLGKLVVLRDAFPSNAWLHRGLPLLVLLVLFLVQILYIVRVQTDRRLTTRDGCSSANDGRARVQAWALGVFAVAQIGVGIWVAVRSCVR